jgi:capsular exopolysaccharide synthesis family protein
MHVTQAFPRGTQVQLVISSAGPGEGKSLVAANLSLCFAEAGIKTLLIDGDIRRGQLHALFGVERRPGLVDVLMDSVSPDLTLRRTSHPCLTLMASGSRRQRGPEHLGSEAVRDLLNQFRSEYDVIIIDSPPLNAGIDPFVLSTLTGNMLFVVRSGVTDYKMAAAKLATMDRLPVRLLGAVLNGIRSQYSEYRYYSYAAGYGLSEGQEEDEPMRLAPIGKPRSRTIGRP